MDTRGLNKVIFRHDAEHDMGPDAPVQWSTYELALLVGKLVQKVEDQQKQIDTLLAAVPSADKRGQS